LADIVDKATRRRMMASIPSRNTLPERRLRSALHVIGIRFRIHRSDLPGTPDIVFPKFKAVAFVHGCFWHRHDGCKKAATPRSDVEKWRAKFETNIRRDSETKRKLLEIGWRVATIWQCAIDSDDSLAADKVAVWLGTAAPELEVGAPIAESAIAAGESA